MRRRFLVALVAIAVIVVALAYGVQIATPPTPSPTPEVTPTLPAPTPAPPTPHPVPPSPKLNMSADFASLKGFNVTWIEHPEVLSRVLVLPPGGFGSITIMLISTGDEDYTISLNVTLVGESPKFEGVKYNLSPSTLNLKAGAEAISILSIEAESDAPVVLYLISVDAHVGGYLPRMPTVCLDLLIYPYAPAYAFFILPPSPGITPTLTKPILPKIPIRPGGSVYVLFWVAKGTEDPSVQVKIDLAHDSGSLPLGIAGEFNSLETAPRSTSRSVVMLTLTTATDVPEGTYRIIATISIGSYATERAFDLAVTSQK